MTDAPLRVKIREIQCRGSERARIESQKANNAGKSMPAVSSLSSARLESTAAFVWRFKDVGGTAMEFRGHRPLVSLPLPKRDQNGEFPAYHIIEPFTIRRKIPGFVRVFMKRFVAKRKKRHLSAPRRRITFCHSERKVPFSVSDGSEQDVQK